jgi:alkylation response protein AidB-like acyl-CoA dehydrogenase
MDFELLEEQTMAIDSLRRCVETEILPLVDGKTDAAFAPDLAHEIMRKLNPYGIGAGWLPEDGGGMGLDYVTSGLLYMELSRLLPDAAGLAYVSEGAAMKIYRQGSAEQKERYLPGMAEGRLIGCGAVTEPGTGSNVRQLRTRAERHGSGWRLNGEKMFISNATVADVATVLARTGENEFTIFLLDRSEHAFQSREIEKLGMNGWSFGSIVMEDVYVDDAFRLGETGRALKEAMSGFERARAWVAVIAAGVARRALDDAIAYACERDQFGVPIASHQLVQGLLSDMACETEAIELMTCKSLAALDKGGRADLPTSMAKAYCAEAAIRVASKGIQVHGAYGVTREYPMERHLRNARMLTIPDGTTQINQLIVGRELTGISAFLGAAGNRPRPQAQAAE